MPIVTNTSAGLEGKKLALTTDLPVSISVKQFPFLATGDGTTDDTAAILDAIAAIPAIGGILFFPAGTYIVDLPSDAVDDDEGCILPTNTANTRICGEGAASIIKVKNNAHKYCTILGGTDFNLNPLDNFEVDHLCFDHNIDNNNITDFATINFQHTIRVGLNSSQIRIHHCEIKNSSSVNNIVVNGDSLTDVWIENNYFHDNGDDPAHTNHDVSVIYTNAQQVVIRDNIIISTGKDDGGATTGIETHGSYHLIKGNIVINYRTGMNITGIFASDTRGVVVKGNVLKGGNLGINIWSQESGAHTTGYGFDGLLIDSNIIELASIADWTTKNPAGFLSGIGFNPGTPMMDSNDITISNNIINHPFELTDVGSNTGSHGIGWVSSTNKTLYRLKVFGNRINQFPMAGIRFSCSLISCDISNNDISNCGNTLDTARAGSLAFRFPMMLAPPNCHGLKVSNNRFYDDLAEITFRPAYFIALTQTVTVAASRVEFLDNTFASIGSAMTGTFQIDNSGALLQPYIRGVVNGFSTTGLGSANQKFALGSQITDPVDGNIWSIDTDQITWREGLITAGATSGFKRLQSFGTTLVAGDFAIGAQWGNTATITAVQGSDSAFFIRVTSAGTGQTINATIVLTYKDGPYAASPIIVGILSNVTNDTTAQLQTHLFTTNTNLCTIVLTTAPVTTGVYTFTCMIVARP